MQQKTPEMPEIGPPMPTKRWQESTPQDYNDNDGQGVIFSKYT